MPALLAAVAIRLRGIAAAEKPEKPPFVPTTLATDRPPTEIATIEKPPTAHAVLEIGYRTRHEAPRAEMMVGHPVAALSSGQAKQWPFPGLRLKSKTQHWIVRKDAKEKAGP